MIFEGSTHPRPPVCPLRSPGNSRCLGWPAASSVGLPAMGQSRGKGRTGPRQPQTPSSDPLTDSICHGEILSGERPLGCVIQAVTQKRKWVGSWGGAGGGKKCPSKGFEVGSVEWAREGSNLPPRLSGSGVEGSREGQLWPGRDWQEHEEDCSRYSIHCPFIAQVTPGVRGTCMPRKSPVIGEVTQKRPRPALDHK